MLLLFEWDDEKNDSNLKKHGVAFELAVVVFEDPMHVTTLDRFVGDEVRWRTIGQVRGKYLLLVAHTLHEEGEEEEVVRIISAREATAHERREYEDGV